MVSRPPVLPRFFKEIFMRIKKFNHAIRFMTLSGERCWLFLFSSELEP